MTSLIVPIKFDSQVWVVDYTDSSGDTYTVGVTDSREAAETLIMRRYIAADDAAEYVADNAAEYADFFGRHRVAVQAFWIKDRLTVTLPATRTIERMA